MIKWEQRNKNFVSRLNNSFKNFSKFERGFDNCGDTPVNVRCFVDTGMRMGNGQKVLLTAYYGVHWKWAMSVCQVNNKVFLGQKLDSGLELWGIRMSPYGSPGNFIDYFCSACIDTSGYSSDSERFIKAQVALEMNVPMSALDSRSIKYDRSLREICPTYAALEELFHDIQGKAKVTCTLKDDQFPKCPDKNLLPYFIYDMDSGEINFTDDMSARDYRRSRKTIDIVELQEDFDKYCKRVIGVMVRNAETYCDVKISHPRLRE